MQSDRIAARQHPFNPLTWSNQQIRLARWEKYSGQSCHTLLATLQSHSISHFSFSHIPTGLADKVLKAPSYSSITRQDDLFSWHLVLDKKQVKNRQYYETNNTSISSITAETQLFEFEFTCEMLHWLFG